MTSEELREKTIQDIIAILRNSEFSLEVRVTDKPTGVKIIYEVTQEQMNMISGMVKDRQTR